MKKNDDIWVPEFQLRLRDLRIKSGKSCVATSELCGFGKNTVSKYESGKAKPTVDSLIRLANHFGVTVDYLLGENK